MLSWFRLLCYIILKAYDKSHSKEIDLIVFNIILDDGLLFECQFIYRDIRDFYKCHGIIAFVILEYLIPFHDFISYLRVLFYFLSITFKVGGLCWYQVNWWWIPPLDVVVKVFVPVSESRLSASLHKDVRTHPPRPKSDFGNK